MRHRRLPFVWRFCANAPTSYVPPAPNDRDDTDSPRVGYTCSKKIGNAVARNRAKRRLREVARLVLGAEAKQGWDYVLVGRPNETITRSFDQLVADLKRAVAKVHT